ncbi:hypothetical protein [Eubacterium oxidoreducens]|uniref:Uncharacterized protein n=1 Tax=Eubacterium oxidoreducens TaxID=1732 RepID=A0A1G6A049_EUBOX|nr:hypothetical protein [Eubacterium oxidoreducens]SDB01636.1 hypothetical protein SAMN02910417_00015 [Eubacterium oxidoreducens]
MMEQEILLQWLKKDAAVNQTELLDRIFGYIVAQILKNQAEKEEKEQFFLTTELEDILENSPVTYRRKLVFWNPSGYLSDDKIKENFQIDDFELSFEQETTDNKQKLSLNYKIEKYKIPLEIELKRLQVEGERIRSRVVKLPYSKKEVTLFEFLAEVNMAEDYLYLFTYLELANEMSYFTELYEILMTQSVSGRLFIKFLKMESEKNQIAITQDLKDLMKDYEDNPYLKKKWMAYRKRNRMPEVTWKEAMKLFHQFFDGIWQAYIQDEIFMDEWMPQLGRFL